MRGDSSTEIARDQASGAEDQKPERDPGRGAGRLTVVSLGPGKSHYLAPAAKAALSKAEVIVGYKTYMELIEPEILAGKKTLTSGMTGEIKRCRIAIDHALEGKNTAIVSSGDSGIYGMAGLIIELVAEQGLLDKVEVDIIPGISALSSAAALLGAPLMHDFAVVSLSDLMTSWDEIEARVDAAARTDFVLVIYNPRSRKRDWQLTRVREVILKYRDENTPAGIVRNAARKGESVRITTLSRMDESTVDMLSILLVGNSKTRVIGARMVTPRGYLEKYDVGRG
ncbi:precorrin-3B C(17)-methyltransferase [delta proteobacterium NaphS2]|nr:precorrin-3B C(17)-methyltransferase [delta proteobacterium NaphS2]